jgi:protein AroM
MKTVGAITIGQAPRDDIVGEMATVLGGSVRIVQVGALDGWSRAEIDALAPGLRDADALVTHLSDGADVIVTKRRIVPLLQGCIERLAPDVDALAILCAGTFPPFASPRPVLLPERCLAAVVDAVFVPGRLGVLVPIPHQLESSAQRWGTVDPRVVVTVASPYEDRHRLVAAAEELERAGVTLVVMECQGFTSAMKQVVREVTGAPALLPTTVLARFLAELA